MSAPAISTQPTSQTAVVGASASFSVTATSDDGTLTYQWQKVLFGSTPAISGATSATLTINPVGGASSGFYRCAVTNTDGTTYSTNATLAVTAAGSSGGGSGGSGSTGVGYVGDRQFEQDGDVPSSTNEYGLDYLERTFSGAPNPTVVGSVVTGGLANFLATVADNASDPGGTFLTVKQRGRRVQGVDSPWARVTVTYCGRLDGSSTDTDALVVDSRTIHTIQFNDSPPMATTATAVGLPAKNITGSVYQYQTVYTYAVYGARPAAPRFTGPTVTDGPIDIFDVRPTLINFPISVTGYINRCIDLNVQAAGAWFEVREVWVRTVSTTPSGTITVGSTTST